MDWNALERRNVSSDTTGKASFKIETKKVSVSKNDVIKLPDGTVIVKDKRSLRL